MANKIFKSDEYLIAMFAFVMKIFLFNEYLLDYLA